MLTREQIDPELREIKAVKAKKGQEMSSAEEAKAVIEGTSTKGKEQEKVVVKKEED